MWLVTFSQWENLLILSRSLIQFLSICRSGKGQELRLQFNRRRCSHWYGRGWPLLQFYQGSNVGAKWPMVLVQRRWGQAVRSSTNSIGMFWWWNDGKLLKCWWLNGCLWWLLCSGHVHAEILGTLWNYYSSVYCPIRELDLYLSWLIWLYSVGYG